MMDGDLYLLEKERVGVLDVLTYLPTLLRTVVVHFFRRRRFLALHWICVASLIIVLLT